jgi:hypothetical protein
MITARTTTQAAEPAPRRDLVGKLLLTGMDWTNANPWFGIVGAVLTIIAYGVFDQVTK